MNSFMTALDSAMAIQTEIDVNVASVAGQIARSGLQAAHVTKADVTGELHLLEAEAIGAAALTVIALGAIAIVWVAPRMKARA